MKGSEPAGKATVPTAGFSLPVAVAKVRPVMDVTVIGYGSLMSGRGLAASGPLRVRQAAIVALTGCRRGFAKLSRYGDRFAMDLELERLPLRGYRMVPTMAPSGEVEALALTVPLADACRLAHREGYDPAVLQQLATRAEAQGLTLAGFLWQLYGEAEYDVVGYRRQLFAMTAFTSAHYIPHPVRLGDTEEALVFLAPGFEGTGADEVISVRQYTGIRTVMGTEETWRQKPTRDQLSYFIDCLLGGAHGISVRDLLPCGYREPQLWAQLRAGIAEVLVHEIDRFLAVTGLSWAQYQQAFGGIENALVRSGLWELLHSGPDHGEGQAL